MPDEKDEILVELKKICKILTLAHGDAIERELGKIANTEKRKVMWVLMDESRMTKDIASVIGVTEEAVNKFLRELSLAELAENPRGRPPRRLINYIPPSWIDLLNKYMKEEKAS